jgi:hypothetical protein
MATAQRVKGDNKHLKKEQQHLPLCEKHTAERKHKCIYVSSLTPSFFLFCFRCCPLPPALSGCYALYIGTSLRTYTHTHMFKSTTHACSSTQRSSKRRLTPPPPKHTHTHTWKPLEQKKQKRISEGLVRAALLVLFVLPLLLLLL